MPVKGFICVCASRVGFPIWYTPSDALNVSKFVVRLADPALTAVEVCGRVFNSWMLLAKQVDSALDDATKLDDSALLEYVLSSGISSISQFSAVRETHQ